jgi:uroporphyrinogen-III synthase
MLVLVTRALNDALRTADRLADLGHRAILSPMLEMVPTGGEWPDGVVEGVLATSAQAFELFSDTAEWPLPEARRLLPLYVVGERTPVIARTRGFEGRATVAQDAATLAKAVVSALAGGPPARLVYLAGRDHKPDLEEELTAAGHMVEAIEVYAAAPAEALDSEAAAMIESDEIGAVLHFSRRSARLFVELAREAGLDIASLSHVTISADAALPLSKAGVGSVRVATEPTEQAMLALLRADSSHVFVDPARGAEP